MRAFHLFLLTACTCLLSSCYLTTAERVQDWNRSCPGVYFADDGQPHVYRVGDDYYLRGTSTVLERRGMALTSFYYPAAECSGTFVPLPGAEEKTVYRKLGKNEFVRSDDGKVFSIYYSCAVRGAWDDWVPELPAGARPVRTELDFSLFSTPGGKYVRAGAFEKDGRSPVAPVLAFPLKWLVDVPVTCVASTVYGLGCCVATPFVIYSQQLQPEPPPPTEESRRVYDEVLRQQKEEAAAAVN